MQSSFEKISLQNLILLSFYARKSAVRHLAYDNYVSLLDNLLADDRRLIVSGLLPRESVDLEPYNDKLKGLCDENNLEYIDHFDGFLLATGEIPETYFHNDKTHLNISGTRKFLLNIDAVCKVKKLWKENSNPSDMQRTQNYFLFCACIMTTTEEIKFVSYYVWKLWMTLT